MLLNILSVVMVYISSCAVAVAIFYLVEKRTATNNEQGMLSGLAGIMTVIFMWVMSWQNWWR